MHKALSFTEVYAVKHSVKICFVKMQVIIALKADNSTGSPPLVG
jgi:hypothetical protein